MNALPRSLANEPRFFEQDICSSALEETCAEVAAAVVRAYGPWNTISDCVEKIDSFLGRHAQMADWREARSDAVADLEAVHALLIEAEAAMIAVMAALKGRGA